jgi:hypothetical protein
MPFEALVLVGQLTMTAAGGPLSPEEAVRVLRGSQSSADRTDAGHYPEAPPSVTVRWVPGAGPFGTFPWPAYVPSFRTVPWPGGMRTVVPVFTAAAERGRSFARPVRPTFAGSVDIRSRATQSRSARR